MARYKVSVTIFRGPSGKTFILPTVLNLVGDLFLALGILCVMYLIIAIAQGSLWPLLLVIAVVRTAVFLLAGILLKTYAKRNARQSYAKELETAEHQEKKS